MIIVYLGTLDDGYMLKKIYKNFPEHIEYEAIDRHTDKHGG